MKTTLIIVVFTDGTRRQSEIPSPPTSKAWKQAMRQVGQQFRGRSIHAAVVIDGIDVLEYNYNEVAEIFGLEA